MDRYFESLVESSNNYLNNLQYLAKEDKKTLSDLFDLQILLNTYNWVVWQSVSESDKIKIEKLIETIILRNPKLEFVKTSADTYYKNVNTPQTIWTWQRVYDNLNLINN